MIYSVSTSRTLLMTYLVKNGLTRHPLEALSVPAFYAPNKLSFPMTAKMLAERIGYQDSAARDTKREFVASGLWSTDPLFNEWSLVPRHREGLDAYEREVAEAGPLWVPALRQGTVLVDKAVKAEILRTGRPAPVFGVNPAVGEEWEALDPSERLEMAGAVHPAQLLAFAASVPQMTATDFAWLSYLVCEMDFETGVAVGDTSRSSELSGVDAVSLGSKAVTVRKQGLFDVRRTFRRGVRDQMVLSLSGYGAAVLTEYLETH